MVTLQKLAEDCSSSASFTLTMATANSPETSVTNDGCAWHLTEGVNVRKREISSLSDRGMACTRAQLASSGLQNGIYYWRYTVKINQHPLFVYKDGEKNKQHLKIIKIYI